MLHALQRRHSHQREAHDVQRAASLKDQRCHEHRVTGCLIGEAVFAAVPASSSKRRSGLVHRSWERAAGRSYLHFTRQRALLAKVAVAVAITGYSVA